MPDEPVEVLRINAAIAGLAGVLARVKQDTPSLEPPPAFTRGPDNIIRDARGNVLHELPPVPPATKG